MTTKEAATVLNTPGKPQPSGLTDKEWQQLLRAKPELLTGFNESIIAVHFTTTREHNSYVPVYSWNRMVETETANFSTCANPRHRAIEMLDFNTVRSIDYMRPPCILVRNEPLFEEDFPVVIKGKTYFLMEGKL